LQRDALISVRGAGRCDKGDYQPSNAVRLAWDPPGAMGQDEDSLDELEVDQWAGLARACARWREVRTEGHKRFYGDRWLIDTAIRQAELCMVHAIAVALTARPGARADVVDALQAGDPGLGPVSAEELIAPALGSEEVRRRLIDETLRSMRLARDPEED